MKDNFYGTEARESTLTVKGSLKNLKKFEQDLVDMGLRQSFFNTGPKKEDICILTYRNGVYGYYSHTDLTINESHLGIFNLPEQHLEALFLLTPTE